MFYSDFEHLEVKGLGKTITGLSRAPVTKKKQGGDIYQFFIPQKFMDFYNKLSDNIAKKRQIDRLIDQFYKEDTGTRQEKTGFLSAEGIANCFWSVGISLKPKQIGQITFGLHQDFEKNFSWPELIELMFGEHKWIETKLRYDLRRLSSNVQTTYKKEEESSGFSYDLVENVKKRT